MRFAILLVSLLSFAFYEVQGLVEESSCPDEFLQLGKKCYYFEMKQQLDWWKAYGRCRVMKADLATIETETESSLIKSHLDPSSKYYYWLGGTDELFKVGMFGWMKTGMAVNYTDWIPGEPKIRGGNEHCLLLWTSKSAYGWNDVDCSQTFYFICEADLIVKAKNEHIDFSLGPIYINGTIYHNSRQSVSGIQQELQNN